MDLEGMCVDREVLRIKETLEQEFSRWAIQIRMGVHVWIHWGLRRAHVRVRVSRDLGLIGIVCCMCVACVRVCDPGCATTASGSRRKWSW
jgi:hypothetical protein